MLGFLEAIDHVVAYQQGVSQTLDIHSVLFGPWGAEEGGAAAWRKKKVVVRVIALHPTSTDESRSPLLLSHPGRTLFPRV